LLLILDGEALQFNGGFAQVGGGRLQARSLGFEHESAAEFQP
jgi:hypothetical protein